MEVPKVPSEARNEARRREAPERREGWGSPSPVWGSGSPQKICEKSTLKLHILLSVSNLWRVTPVAKQSSAFCTSVIFSGAKNFFNP